MRHSMGFSLFESMITAGLVIFFCTIGITQANRWKEDFELRNAAILFTEILNQARTISISCGLPVAIDIDPDSGAVSAVIKPKYRFRGNLRLDSYLRFTRVPSRRIVFYSSGACAPSGSFEISNSRNSAKIVVSIMGRVRWRFIQPS